MEWDYTGVPSYDMDAAELSSTSHSSSQDEKDHWDESEELERRRALVTESTAYKKLGRQRKSGEEIFQEDTLSLSITSKSLNDDDHARVANSHA